MIGILYFTAGFLLACAIFRTRRPTPVPKPAAAPKTAAERLADFRLEQVQVLYKKASELLSPSRSEMPFEAEIRARDRDSALKQAREVELQIAEQARLAEEIAREERIQAEHRVAGP